MRRHFLNVKITPVAFEWHRCSSIQTKQKVLFWTQIKWRWMCVCVFVCAHAYVYTYIIHVCVHTIISPWLCLFSDIILRYFETAQYSLIIPSLCLGVCPDRPCEWQMCSACQMRTVFQLYKCSVKRGRWGWLFDRMLKRPLCLEVVNLHLLHLADTFVQSDLQ